MRKIVVVGGCGFIGANFIHYALHERADVHILNLDALTYAGNLANLESVASDPRLRFMRVDIGDRAALGAALEGEEFESIVNFAAESHVDRSILYPEIFVQTNVLGTAHLLDVVRARPGVRLLQVSTDEVYGSLGDTGVFTEATPIQPSSPYSASKAAADLLAQAYHRTFGTDVVITRCSNNYGPYQFPEKLIPLMITNVLTGRPLTVHGTGGNVRDWIHVEDHCRGVLAALERGRAGEVYNFGGAAERRNIDIIHAIADRLCGNRDLVRFVADRPGGDWRYAMDFQKASAQLGWAPRHAFEESLQETIDWYLANEPWWRDVMTEEYRGLYDRLYGGHPELAGVITHHAP